MATTTKGIYYPNDGTKAADVLTDLKAMAESIDNTIVKEINDNKYDDTEIKQDISEIKQEQATQNKNIENNTNKNTEQDELISKLRNAVINAETEEAKSLHVIDANRFGSLEVLGNAEQETREGYSIWDYLSVARSSAGGLTIEKDLEEGYLTVNGTLTSNYTRICNDTDITDILEDGQTYTLWQERYKDSSTDGIYLQVRETNSSGSNTDYNSRDASATFTVNKQNTYTIMLQTSSIELTGTLTNYKNRYMLYKGTDTKTFELPGASPSINYPSKIVCLGSNKNKFNKDTITQNYYVNKSTGELVANTSNNASDYIEINDNFVIMQGIVENDTYAKYNKDKVFVSGGNLQNNVAIDMSNAKYIRFTIKKTADLDKVKVEEGTQATSYSPYRTR